MSVYCSENGAQIFADGESSFWAFKKFYGHKIQD